MRGVVTPAMGHIGRTYFPAISCAQKLSLRRCTGQYLRLPRAEEKKTHLQAVDIRRHERSWLPRHRETASTSPRGHEEACAIPREALLDCLKQIIVFVSGLEAKVL